MVAIFGLLIANAVYGSFASTDPHSKIPTDQEDRLERLMRATGHAPVKDLQEIAAAMRPAHTKDPQAALVYAVTETELHLPLKNTDLAALAKSANPRHRDFADIFVTPPPAKDRLLALAAKMPKERFVYELAGVQAREKAGDKLARKALTPNLDSKRTRLFGAAAVAAFVLGCILLVWYAVSQASGTIRWADHPLQPVSKLDADRLAVRAAQFMGMFIAVGLLLDEAQLRFSQTSLKSGLSDSQAIFSTVLWAVLPGVAIILGTVALTAVPVVGRKISLADYGLDVKRLGFYFLWGSGGYLAAVPVVAFAIMVEGLFNNVLPSADHPVEHLLRNPADLPLVGTAFFLACIQAPFFEEITFRGTLMPAISGLFANEWSRRSSAILASSLLFASIHPQGIGMWLALGSIGAVNGVLTYQTRSVLPGMFMHAFFNGVILFISLTFMR